MPVKKTRLFSDDRRIQCIAITVDGVQCKRFATDGEGFCTFHTEAPPIERKKDRQVCEGTTRAGNRCKNSAIVGRRFCKVHGGKNLSGDFKPEIIKKKSRLDVDNDIPLRLREVVKASLSDPDQLSMSNEVAILDSLVVEKLGELETGLSQRALRDVERLWKIYRDPKTKEEPKEDAGKKLDRLLNNLKRNNGVRRELVSLMETRSKVATLEQNRQLTASRMVTEKEMKFLIDAMVEGLITAVNKHAEQKVGRKIIVDAHHTYRKLVDLEAYNEGLK